MYDVHCGKDCEFVRCTLDNTDWLSSLSCCVDMPVNHELA